MFKPVILCSLLSTLMLSATVSAAPDSMQNLLLRDQHETPVKVSANIRYVIFAHDMSGKDLVKEMLEEKPADYLDTHDALFVADVSGMPRIIARMFAYPSMRKLPYRMLLDEVGNRTADWERRDSAVTLYRVDNFRVTGFEFIDSVAALEAAINTPPAAEEVPATE